MILLFLLLLIILILLLPNKFTTRENFAINLGDYLKFMKKDPHHSRLESTDLDKIRKIQQAYGKPDYYSRINKIGLKYLDNPPLRNKKIRVNYRKTGDSRHLLPIKF